eukprot:5961831-Alexandrium_andersonii.AAC.1
MAHCPAISRVLPTPWAVAKWRGSGRAPRCPGAKTRTGLSARVTRPRPAMMHWRTTSSTRTFEGVRHA